jgi:anti-sigma factor RsiW
MKTWADADTSPWNYAAVAGGIVNSAVAVPIAPAVTGKRNYITDIQVSHATLGAATELAIRDGAGGAVLWRTTLGTAAVENSPFNFTTPLVSSPGNLLEVITLTAVTGGVYVNAQGFVGPPSI